MPHLSPAVRQRPILPTVALEEALLTKLIREGWEQGCWLPDGVGHYALDAATQHEFLQACAQRQRIDLEEQLFQADEVPEFRNQDTDTPADTLWMILSQRCDLIRGLWREPTVLLVRATKWETRAAKDLRRSAHLHIVREEGAASWVADFRETITIPKPLLVSFPARQLLPDDAIFRRRFALKLAQRLWRRPVPRDISATIERPLIDQQKKVSAWKRFCAQIAEFLVAREETGQLVLYAICDDRLTADEEIAVARFFDETVLPYLDAAAGGMLNVERSGVFPPAEVTLPMVFQTYKLGLDFLSSGTADTAPNF